MPTGSSRPIRLFIPSVTSFNFFSSNLKYRYVDGEGGNLTWYPSGIEPVPLFMLLAGWKNDAPKSGLTDLYRSLETLCGNQHGRRVRRYVPLSFLRRTAYLLGDNSPLEFEKNLAEHFQCETFRLGQAFAPPAEGYKQRCGTHAQEWNFIKPSTAEQPTWQIPFKDTENAFSIASWRNDNERGDLLILDGHLDRAQALYNKKHEGKKTHNEPQAEGMPEVRLP